MLCAQNMNVFFWQRSGLFEYSASRWIDGAASLGGRCKGFDGRPRQVKVLQVGGIVGRLLASRRFFLSAAKKEGPDTVASRGQVPRSSPRLPPVMAEGGMRGAFSARETAEYLDSRSRNLT
jgi:hypothetical protein